MSIYTHIETLVQYGIQQGLLEREDAVYVRNRILATLGLDDWENVDIQEDDIPSSCAPILACILDWAYENGRLEVNTVTERDIWDAELMNCLLARPSEIIRQFRHKYDQNREEATNWLYALSVHSNYIRTDRLANNKIWKAKTAYGELDITINLSKPEKDPKEIAKLKDLPSTSYPTCLLCSENEGYKGTLRHPARGNHRVIPFMLDGQEWCFQYSPYGYYNEHCIIFSRNHVPMKIGRNTFSRLLAFVTAYPHYFAGANADLPIVGGSILSHDHYQGGKYTFAMEEAPIEREMQLPSYPSLIIGVVNWPMSVIRVRGAKEDVLHVTDVMYQTWQQYSDPSADIYAFSGDTPHNTVTPIARRRGEWYEMDIVLRNNRTSDEHPYGIFHPHEELHHIKKENIGLIEVMGLAVLPGRLESELGTLARYFAEGTSRDVWEEEMLKHWDWYEDIRSRYESITAENVHDLLQYEVGKRFETVLEHAGVFKRTEEGQAAFWKFLQTVQDVCSE